MKQILDTFKTNSVDALLYAGPIEMAGYDALCDLLEKRKTKSKGVLLYLVTSGGSPNAGYRIARALCHHYGPANFRVAIPAECKSAGTLICIGASSLVFFDRGELGPLDVQFRKKDEIFEQGSGLDILRGMTYLRQEALDSFREYLLEINAGSGLSTKTASEISSALVKGLFEPMFAQIDPVRLGEMNAALQIAHEYGTRLVKHSKGLKSGALVKLIHGYPTHSFVIDRAEARTIFERADPPADHEAAISGLALRLASSKLLQNRANVVDLLELVEDAIKKAEESTEPTPAVGRVEASPTQDGGVGQAASSASNGQSAVGRKPRNRRSTSSAQNARE